MSAPKKSSGTRKATRRRKLARASIAQLPDLSNVVHDLKEVTAYLETARKGVARGYYCLEMPMLEEGIKDLRSVLIRLERIEVKFASFRKSNGGAS